MTVTLTTHGEQLLETARARGLGHSPEEIVERALEAVVISSPSMSNNEREFRHQAVTAMLDFNKKHHLTLGPGVRIKDLIQEGRRY